MSVYVVTGRHRTGTSMMMHALSVGGLTAVYDLQVEQDIRSRVVCDYDPNPGGFFSAPHGILPHDVMDGELIKCSMYSWPKVIEGDYKVVRMVRDEQIRSLSFAGVFGAPDTVNLRPYEAGEQNLLSRSDCQIVTLDFDQVRADPIAAITQLINSDWPIDISAASIIS